MVLLTVASLIAVVLVQFWASTSADAQFVLAERRGVTYLGPLSRLIDGLTVAQSAAVRGTPVDDAAVRAAIADVDAVDATVGGPLQVQQRWHDLRPRITDVLSNPAAGAAAYQRFADVIVLATDLQTKVNDVSNLILDPVLSSYYLMDAAVLRLPVAMVAAGRGADLVALAGGRSPTGEQQTALAVARYQVANAAAAVATGLKKSANGDCLGR
jgi:hypothetical protein